MPRMARTLMPEKKIVLTGFNDWLKTKVDRMITKKPMVLASRKEGEVVKLSNRPYKVQSNGEWRRM